MTYVSPWVTIKKIKTAPIVRYRSRLLDDRFRELVPRSDELEDELRTRLDDELLFELDERLTARPELLFVDDVDRTFVDTLSDDRYKLLLLVTLLLLTALLTADAVLLITRRNVDRFSELSSDLLMVLLLFDIERVVTELILLSLLRCLAELPLDRLLLELLLRTFPLDRLLLLLRLRTFPLDRLLSLLRLLMLLLLLLRFDERLRTLLDERFLTLFVERFRTFVDLLRTFVFELLLFTWVDLTLDRTSVLLSTFVDRTFPRFLFVDVTPPECSPEVRTCRLRTALDCEVFINTYDGRW